MTTPPMQPMPPTPSMYGQPMPPTPSMYGQPMPRPPLRSWLPYSRVGPTRDNRARNALLVVTLLLSGPYAIQPVIDYFRPTVDGRPQPALGVLAKGQPGPYVATFWAFVVVMGIALFIAIIGAAIAGREADPARRQQLNQRWQLLAAGVQPIPFLIAPAHELWHVPRYVMICVPSTVLALWLVRRMQRFRRIPLGMLLGVFVWGALIATGYGATMENWCRDEVVNYLIPSNPAQHREAAVSALNQWVSSVLVSAGIFEELGKGAVVLLVFILWRRHVDNVVAGIALGATAGIGFNLFESAQYMGGMPGYASSQYYMRQSVELMGLHVAFAAAIGAGIGIARQLEPRRRFWAIASGFCLAIVGHSANDVLLVYYSRVKDNWFNPGRTTDMLFFTPMFFVVLQGPYVALYLLLLRRGTKDQRAALDTELGAESTTGFGAVTPADLSVLMRPSRRFYLRFATLTQASLTRYRALGRLYATQLELGTALWHRRRYEVDPFSPDEGELRQHALHRKRQLAELPLPGVPGQPITPTGQVIS
jgi:RsiW-degrading membrane proteinase PrsW (M82 family)